MPHRSLLPLRGAARRRARRQAPGALLLALAVAAAACSGTEGRGGDIRAAVPDSTRADVAEEGRARAKIEIPPGPRGDSVRAWIALRDSAAALDSAFQRRRDEANTRALELNHRRDRVSPGYARAFEEWRRLAAAADSARRERDRAREREERLRERVGVE
jgi:hypothetical protein